MRAVFEACSLRGMPSSIPRHRAMALFHVVSRVYVVLFVLTCLLSSVVGVDHRKHRRECTPGMDSIGYTEPYGDILVKYGDPLDITCILYDDDGKAQEGNYSQDLYFMIGGKNISKEMITIINSTTINLHIDKPALSSATFTCKYKEHGVCVNSVNVGTKPQNVTDFDCISYNYENLTCTFTPPNNYAITTYNLTYYFPGRAGRYKRFSCPDLKKLDNGKMRCLWTISSLPPYRLVQRTFYFDLFMKNDLGTNNMSKTFSHFKYVLPGSPENLTWVNTTSNSVLLYWFVPLSMQNFPPGLEHRIIYQSEYGEKSWQFGGLVVTGSDKHMGYVYYNLTGLKYAHALYDIRVSMRSAVADPSDESMWSKNSSITARTKSTIPGVSPKTNIGSFEIVSAGSNLNNSDVYVYWQQIPEEIKNGEDFTYHVSIANSGYAHVKPVEITNAYAKFKNLSISETFAFRIRSQNKVGKSFRESRVIVPKHTDRAGEPISFAKTSFGDKKYELYWEHPKKRQFTQDAIKNYTIFWCTHKRDRPYQCSGYLNWIEVTSDITAYNVTVIDDKIYQFAISANTENSSSGMVWASCTVIHNKPLGKMKNVWIPKFGSTYIELRWKLDCSDRIGSVTGFVVYYCDIVSPTSTNCKEPEKNLTVIGDSTIDRAVIPNLKPYHTYMLAVSVITKHSESQHSDYYYQTTLEDAPYPPRNPNVIQITNDSLTISWEQPMVTNGKLNNYKVFYNGFVQEFGFESTNITLENLVSYTDYNVSVLACTVECSEPLFLPLITTKVGYPSEISTPNVGFQNDSIIVVKWDPPHFPRGKNDYYEVKFEQKYANELKSAIFNVTDTMYSVENCGENAKYDTFYVSVRAVNVDENETFVGPWSKELESYCSSDRKNWIWAVVVIVSIFGIIIFGYLCNRCYIKYKHMKNVQVKLPQGLNATINIADSGLDSWHVPRQEDDTHSTSLPDEELLLTKFPDAHMSSAESSGCGSGHNSATSSLKSGTHISGISDSDSGTEHPRSTSSEELQTSLRLRLPRGLNKSLDNVRKPASPAVLTPNVPPTNTQSGYCVLGINMTPVLNVAPAKTETNPSETFENSEQSTSMPYVMTGELYKTPNPGYIPLEMLKNNSEQDLNALETTSIKDKELLTVADLPSFTQLDKTACNVSDNKHSYVQLAEPLISAKKCNIEEPLKDVKTISSLAAKTGYVTIGDISESSPQSTVRAIKANEPNKGGYVPHRHFEVKSIKED